MRALKPDPAKDPTIEFEKELLNEFKVKHIIGIDEAGRGAIAGPVAVGAQVYSLELETFPEGLRDSKLLSEKRRNWLLPKVESWGEGVIGFGEAHDIDSEGITKTLAQTARNALLQLHERGIDVNAAVILLDGSHDWLSPALKKPLNVITKTEADRLHASVAAASLRAKTARDTLMIARAQEFPDYGWASNKGYGAKAHYDAIKTHGLTPFHRKTWINI